MFSEKTYEEYYKNLIVTIFEVETYKEHNLRYSDLSQTLNLYSRLTFYLIDLLDETSLVSFYLHSSRRKEAISLLLYMQPILETHLQDNVATYYLSIPKQSFITAKQVVKALQPTKLDLDAANRYKLHFYETFLEYTNNIQQDYFKEPSIL